MSIPEVDPKRIGCAGLSLGGEMAMWLAAMDQRVQAALVAGWTPTIEHLSQNAHCPCWQVDGLEDTIDFPDIFGLIAPRPLMIQQGEKDREFPAALGRATYERAAAIYGALGHRSRIELAMHPFAHQVMPDVALAFFQRTLGGHAAIPTRPHAKPAQQDAVVSGKDPPFWVTGAFGAITIAALAYALWLRRRQRAAAK